MVTAGDPAFDILEMPIDDYLVNPVGRTDVPDAVTAIVERAMDDHTLREYYTRARKRHPRTESHRRSHRPATRTRLATRLDELGERPDVAVAGFDDEFESVDRDVTADRETDGRQ